MHTFPKHFLISHSSKHSSQFAFSVTAIVKINTSIAYFSAFNLKVSFFKFYFCSLSWLIFKFPVVFFFFFSCAILILLFLSLYFWLLCLYLTWEPGSLPSFFYLLRSSFQPHGCHYHIYTNKTKFKFSVSPSCPGTSIWMFCHCCSLSPVWLFATTWTAARQASLSFTTSWALFKPMSTESVIPSNHLILCRPLLLLPSIFPSIRIFSNESVLRIRWPKYWSFSFSISPSNDIQGWFLLGWTGLITLQSKGLSSFLPPWLESINSLVLILLHGPTLTSIHGYWKNHSFDYTDLCCKSDVSAF